MFKDRHSFRRIVTTTFVLTLGAIATNEVIASPDLGKAESAPNSKSLYIPDSREYEKTGYASTIENQIDTEALLDKIMNSQRRLSINYAFIAGGTDEAININGGATLFEFENDFVLVTAGHLFNYQNVGKVISTYLDKKYHMKDIWTQNELVKNIKIDEVELDRSKFGYYFEKEEIGEGKDIGYIVIDKNALTANQIEQLKNGALRPEDISYEKESESDVNLGVCYSSADKTKPIITLDAKILDKYKNFDIVGPFPIEYGCSGNGMFGRDQNGNLTFKGVVIQLPELEKYKGSAVINMVSTIGRGSVESGIIKARYDINLQKTNPHTR